MKKTILIVIIAILLSGGLGVFAGYNLKPEQKCKECEKCDDPDNPIVPIDPIDPDDEKYTDVASVSIRYLKYNDKLELNDRNFKLLTVIKSKEEYDNFITTFDLQDYLEADESYVYNENYQYVMVIMEADGCGEEIKPNKYRVDDNNTLLIKTDVTVSCGVCALEQKIFEIAIPKDVAFQDVDLDFRYHTGAECDPDVAYKPVLYLYPEKETAVDVTFAHPELLTTTYPKYINGWHVTAKPNGDLFVDNKYYYALYWEEETYNKVDFSEGFYVTKDNAIEFLEDKLTTLGLTPREQNEFIKYWLPILEKNDKSLVYFELTDSLQQANALNITPTPDSLLRIRIHIKKVDNEVKVKEQVLPTFTRTGFTAVEWGGVIY